MDNLKELVDGPRQFSNDSIALLKRCKKPDQKGKHYAITA
jgi:hypothetical protein